MSYTLNFASPSGADWAEAIEAIDDETNRPLADLDTALIELQVRDDCNGVRLKATTEDGTITVPQDGMFQWRFTKEQMSGLCKNTTYRVGCRITPDGGGTTALFDGYLAYLDGEFA